MTSIRTCVGCGQRHPQSELVRFTADRTGALHLDGCRRAAGRGAYLHRSSACWQAFAARRGAVRSLRANPSRVARVVLCEALGGRSRAAVTGREG